MIKVFNGGNHGCVEVSFFVTRKDGTIEPTITQRYESLGFRVRKFARALRRALPFLGLLWLLARSVMQGVHAHAHTVAWAATVVVNGGQAIDANRVFLGAGTAPVFVGWGTGAGTAAVTDTTLFSESPDETRTNGTASRVTTTVTNDTGQVVGALTVVSNNKTITNVGLFDAVTSGNLFIKADFAGQALLIGDSITFTIKDRFS
jgi:hypothetical protein